MSRRPNTDVRRAEIVRAFLPVLAAHGYEKATVQLIAREAGLTTSLIHYHFGSKAEILLALVHALAAAARARFEAAAAAANSPAARLRAYLHARLGLGEGESPEAVAAWVMIGAEALRQPEVRDIYQGVVADELALLQGLVEDCLRAAGKRRRQAGALAAALAALMEGAYQLASAAGEVMPARYAEAMAVELVERFIAAEPKA